MVQHQLNPINDFIIYFLKRVKVVNAPILRVGYRAYPMAVSDVDGHEKHVKLIEHIAALGQVVARPYISEIII